jgi:peptidyl-tRNA hydrolase
VAAWVLSKASVDSRLAIEASIESAMDALPLLLEGDDIKAMTALHSEHHGRAPLIKD